MLGTLVLATLVFGVVALARGGRAAEDSPATTFLSVAVQDVVFIVVAISFAAITARPRAWHFGLRPTRFWSTVGWAALGLFTYFTFTFAYEALVQPRGRQSVAESLGVNDSTALLVLGGFAIIVMAPIAEEFFFRAFVYRSLRNSFARRLGVPAGAVLGALSVGLLFGSLHIEPGRVAQTLPLVPVLAALGVMFCLVYERTGSLFAVIALHATINSIGYLAVAENSGPVVLVFGGGMLVGCVLVPRLLARSPATQEV